MPPKPFTREERKQRALALGIQVDDEDTWLLEEFTWNVSDRYVVTWLKREPDKPRTCARLHHFIVGQPINGDDIDHKDRNPRNNRRSNLRYATHANNLLNTGVTDQAEHIKQMPSGAYQVIIGRNMKKHYIGSFPTYEAAKEARDKCPLLERET